MFVISRKDDKSVKLIDVVVPTFAGRFEFDECNVSYNTQFIKEKYLQQ